jgi:hypothetical protein
LVAAGVVVVAGVVTAHLLATFLYNAPANPVSRRFAAPVSWWMDPVFQQNWRLFAPDPASENVSVWARASLSPDGRVTGWVDLSARDAADALGDPVPGRLNRDALRNAWLDWAASHDGKGDANGSYGAVTGRYLLNVVVDRLRPLAGGRIASVQVRVVTTPIPGPGRSAAQTAPRTRVLDWWPVP